MFKNIFETRCLTDMDGNFMASVNIDETGRFYAFSIYSQPQSEATFDADNATWITETLFPALQNWIYEGQELPDELENELVGVRRRDRVAIYEMITTAVALGWVNR